ncbi:hypothetical protein [Mucilaginibacter panaciglaebae]|uniref:Universal stress protein n=1 Tax=Mucilaginibacter panaciglaebae TaxID=502331 RepID=A0ABP7WF48_9SPHI
MDEILFLTNDVNNAQSLKFAHQFANQNRKDLVVAQIGKFEPIRLLTTEPVMNHHSLQRKQLNHKTGLSADISPRYNNELPLKTIDASCLTENTLAAHIRQKSYAMIISQPGIGGLNLQTVLNQINCPLMLLPYNLAIVEIKRMVYLTDLRFCQQQVLNYLDKFKRSSMLLAHICEPGLPDLVPSYGNELFADTVGRHASGPELFFSHIRESNLEKMIDTLISTMRTDMLVCLNRRSHFQRILGEHIPKRLPDCISVPLLVFPC